MLIVAQANPDLEKTQALIGVIGILAGAALALFFVIRIFIRSQKHERDAQATHDSLLRKAQLRVPELLALLKASPEITATQDELRQIVAAFPHFSSEIYAAALNAVEASGGAFGTKRFALELGRIARGMERPEGVPTTYDEQAIRNDISARTDAM